MRILKLKYKIECKAAMAKIQIWTDRFGNIRITLDKGKL